MASSQSARIIVDLIASGATANEVREAVNNGLFETSIECMEDYKNVIGQKFFDSMAEAANQVTKGAKKAMPMERSKGKMPKGYEQSAEAKRQNDELLATGENAAGGLEADMYPGETPKRGAMGHMNPKGVPQRSYSGDRRPNANGPILPNERGTVPNGSGV